jgi:hypothetical protein
MRASHYIAIGAATLAAGFFIFYSRADTARAESLDLTVITRAEQQDSHGISYVVSVSRWQDGGHHSNRYHRKSDRFRVELFQDGRFLVSSFEFEGTVQVTNAVVTWPKLEEFAVTFDKAYTVRCAWDDRKASWEQQ